VITQTAGTINAGDDLVLGHEAGSNGTCNVEGDSVNVDNGVFVGVRGSGTLSVSGGGQLDVAGHLFVGDDLNSNGSVNVNRAFASVDITDSLVGGGRDISQSGQGSLTISDGAVNVGSSLKIWSTGTVNLSGGTLRAQSIDHTQGGTFNFTGGELHVEMFDGDLTQNGGILAAGASVGTTTITGDYTMANLSDTTVEIELVGAATGQFDQVVVTGTATLGGTLDVLLVNGYTPQAGDRRAILVAGRRAGRFEHVNLPPLSSSLAWDIEYLATGVELRVVTGATDSGK